jgi:hypothetical protein
LNQLSKRDITMRRLVAIVLSLTFMLLPTAPLVAAPAGAQVPVNGVINGTALSAVSQPLAFYTVRARNLQTGEIAGTTTTNAAGAFSFSSLPPANYVVEVVDQDGRIVGGSAAIGVAGGTTTTVTVTATATATETAAIAGPAAGGISKAVIVSAVAAAAGIAGVVVITQTDASASR